MPKITLWPSGNSFEIDSDTPLLKALRDNGVHVNSSCGGVASCSDCVVKILSGEDHLTPAAYKELALLGNVFHITKERLCCQTKITGDVTVDTSRHMGAGPVKEKKTPRPRSMTKTPPVKAPSPIKRREKVEVEDHKKRVEEWKQQRVERDALKPKGRKGGFQAPRTFSNTSRKGSR